MVRKILSLVLVLNSGAALACQCPDIPLTKKVADSDYIYIGLNISASLQEGDLVENKMKPIEVLKGVPDQYILMSKGGPITLCSTKAAVGLNYVVFGRIGEVPSISLCSYSQYVESSTDVRIQEIREAVNKQRNTDFGADAPPPVR